MSPTLAMPLPAAMTPSRPPRRDVLPGLRLTLGFTLLYLGLIILLPLSGLFITTASLGVEGIVQALWTPRVLAALRLSFGAALLAAAVCAVMGLLVAWVLKRYRFPGRAFFDGLVDLPIALPTAVAGIALTALYAPNGWLGAQLLEWGFKVAYTPLGIVFALIFVGLPFVVRTLQPVLEELEHEQEEAAATLGASPLRIFFRVTLPELLPALITGTTMAFARAVGEYGSVIFIAGNIPLVSEIAPLLIVTKLEQYDYAGATALASAMLVISFALLLMINLLQAKFLRVRA